MRLFALNATHRLGDAVARQLGVSLSPHEEREFEDGEHKARPLESVRGHAVHVIQSLHGDERQRVDERLCRLLFFLATLADHGATSTTAVIPYLAYARKDRRTKARDPLMTRYVAQLLECVGVAQVLALDVHNPAAFENAFRCRSVNLDMRAAFTTHLLPFDHDRPVVVVSPDPGGVKRAQLFREHLEAHADRAIGWALIDKRRSAGVVSGGLLVGDVAGASVLLVDDMISTGGTLLRAAASCRNAGAAEIVALATHGLLLPGADTLLQPGGLDRLIVSDSVESATPMQPTARAGIEIIGVAPTIADAILRFSASDGT